jgi:hypothetical protein
MAGKVYQHTATQEQVQEQLVFLFGYSDMYVKLDKQEKEAWISAIEEADVSL